jgi:hypothetical protein
VHESEHAAVFHPAGTAGYEYATIEVGRAHVGVYVDEGGALVVRVHPGVTWEGRPVVVLVDDAPVFEEPPPYGTRRGRHRSPPPPA